MPAAVPRDKVKESDCVVKYNRSSCVVTFGRRLQSPSIKETCVALITRSTAEWWSVKQMLRIVSIKEFYPTSLLSSCLSLRQPASFSSVFPHFFSVLSFSFLSPIPALVFMLVCWQRPGRPNCGVWRAPCVWSRDGRCQGGHTCSLLALCLAGCGAAGSDGWMMGMVCWHALWSLSANGVLLFCFPSACVDLHWQLLCSLKSVEPKVCLTEKKKDFFLFPFLTS